jgi:hypothetical protein
MITQFQTTEPQVAILAACPRPRALSLSALSLSAFPATSVACAPAGAGWPFAAAPIAASVRRPDSANARSAAGYAQATRVLTDSVRVDVEVGTAGGRNVGGNAESGTAGTGMTSSKQQSPQYKQHLTDRREPVTWRPPH